jgi:hypothetical protein
VAGESFARDDGKKKTLTQDETRKQQRARFAPSVALATLAVPGTEGSPTPVARRSGRGRVSVRAFRRRRTFCMIALRFSAYALMAALSPSTGTSRSFVASSSARNCFCWFRNTSFTMSPPSA